MTRGNAVRFVIALLLLGGAAFELWRRDPAPQIHDVGGFTMGSTWSARVVGPPALNVVELRCRHRSRTGRTRPATQRLSRRSRVVATQSHAGRRVAATAATPRAR